MSIELRKSPYTHDGIEFDGAIAVAGDDPRPGVLVIHGWEGRSAAQEKIALRLAELGYNAFCVDLYGDGRRGSTPDECNALMTPLVSDRRLLRRRLLAVVDTVAALPQIDASRMAAIGFCFGGLCVLDLARANAPLRAVASFHGVLTPPGLPAPPRIDAKVIVFHGWDDPLAPPQDVLALATELSAAHADWQLLAFGGTMHAFMAEGLNAPEQGLQYNERSARRAWASLLAHLNEAFATTDSQS
jgi:dienelactone hydrolase